MERPKAIDCLNRSTVKKLVLYKISRLRPGWEVTRVSKEYLDDLAASLERAIDGHVQQSPSIGKTFNPLKRS